MNKTLAGLIIFLVLGGGVAWVALKGGGSDQASNPNQNGSGPTQTFTAEEVAAHNSEADCWLIISGKVYNVTEFISSHPGGEEILRGCGNDATTLFMTRTTEDGEQVGSGTPHSSTAQETLGLFYIGDLAQ